VIGGDDTRHGGLYRRSLVHVEETLLAHSDGLLLCGQRLRAQAL
jgi:hypothetical protein